MKMIRKQIYISDEQETKLKQRARELRVSESALIRYGIDQAGELRQPGALDEHAWQNALAFMRERARIEAAKQERGWSREELYDEPSRRLPG